MTLRLFLKRLVVPVLLAATGAALLVYGAAIHAVPVAEEREIEESIEDPAAFGLPPGFSEDPVLADPGGMDSGSFAPPPMFTKIKRTVLVTADSREPTLVWEVTIGGLERLDTGELQRTYSGAAPSLCPS